MTLSVTSHLLLSIDAIWYVLATPFYVPPYGIDCAETSTTFAAPGTEAAEIRRSSVQGHTSRREATNSIAGCLSASSDLDLPYPRSHSGVRSQGLPPSSACPVISTWRFQPRVNGGPPGAGIVASKNADAGLTAHGLLPPQLQNLALLLPLRTSHEPARVRPVCLPRLKPLRKQLRLIVLTAFGRSRRLSTGPAAHHGSGTERLQPLLRVFFFVLFCFFAF